MVMREVFGLAAGVLILAGIAYAIYNGKETASIIGTAGSSFAGVVQAATMQGAKAPA